MSQAEMITRALAGRWHGSYGVAMCPAHDNTRTFALSLSDAEDGRLMMTCHAGCDFLDVIGALRRRGILAGGVRNSNGPEQGRAPRPLRLPNVGRGHRELALKLWGEARPIVGTAAETYLRGRGISCDLPETLRFHPACPHGPSRLRLPALIAKVEGGEDLAIHRTFLRLDGAGKAHVMPDKMMLGRVKGGHVELAYGDGPLVVAEGIETGLALASGLLRRPATVWAALSASGMGGVRLPVEPGRLTIATDGDAAGVAAGNRLAFRAAAAGWKVNLLGAPLGQDWNDVLRQEGGAA